MTFVASKTTFLPSPFQLFLHFFLKNNPTHLPSSAEKRCEIVDGIFGKEGSSQFVTFCYEVETVEVPKDSTENIIAAIEIAMAEMILPPLFGPACPSMRRLTRRKLAATGVSVNPTDVLLADGEFKRCPFDLKLCLQ